MTQAFQRMTRRKRIERIYELCKERRLTIDTDGKTWRIYGPGVYVYSCDIANVDERDLAPAFDKATA